MPQRNRVLLHLARFWVPAAGTWLLLGKHWKLETEDLGNGIARIPHPRRDAVDGQQRPPQQSTLAVARANRPRGGLVFVLAQALEQLVSRLGRASETQHIPLL